MQSGIFFKTLLTPLVIYLFAQTSMSATTVQDVEVRLPSSVLILRGENGRVRVVKVTQGNAMLLHNDDLIAKLNGKTVTTPEDIFQRVRSASGDSTLSFGVVRNKEEITINSRAKDWKLLAPPAPPVPPTIQ